MPVSLDRAIDFTKLSILNFNANVIPSLKQSDQMDCLCLKQQDIGTYTYIPTNALSL